MQVDRVYDAPETSSVRQPTHKSSLTKIFLVRKSGTSQKKVLSVRLSDDRDPSFVQDFTIHEDCSNTTFSLEGSAVTFSDLFHLISFYCVTRDILPFILKLPLAIATARSHKKLKTISHLGIEFWSSALNVREPPEEGGSESPQEQGPPGKSEPEVQVETLRSPLRTRPPGEVGQSSGNGALSFVNPLFALDETDKSKRTQFKRSFKVRVSTETSSPLSPPTEPPPPVPCEQGGSQELLPRQSWPFRVPSSDDDASYKQPKAPLAPPRLKKQLMEARTARLTLDVPLSPPAEEKYRVPTPVSLQPSPDPADPPKPPLTSPSDIDAEQRLSDASCLSVPEVDGLGLGLLYGSPPPPISEVDTQSLSSEGEEGEEGPAEVDDPRPPPPRSRSVRWMVCAPFWKMNEVFSSFSSPEKKLIRVIEDRSRDRHTYLGGLVQEFLSALREGKGYHTSGSEFLQPIRQFMTHMKMFLIHSSELESTVDIFIEEEEKDHLLEMAMHKSVLKPLRRTIEASLREFRLLDGSLQQIRDNIQLLRQAGPQSLGVRVSVPDIGALEKIKQRFTLMQKTYSPIKKVNFLLQACKLIYERMKGAQGEPHGADEFLPTMTYIIAECDLPELSLEVEYMMELLDQSELMGEGGYYLTTLYASLFELQNYHMDQLVLGISNEIRNSLKQWHKRRRTYEPVPSVNDFQNFLRVAYQDPCNGCTAKTLVVRPAETTEDLCRICAEKFKVQEPGRHGLYLVVDDSWRLLPRDSHPQQIKAGLQGQDETGYYHFVYKPVEQQVAPRGNRKLLRDNAIDLGGGLVP
ncbi:ras and Rab interactor 2-like isoform X2 [Heterodontus francisci]|uniref:ras and Rab interactor 2-like isoform X2 n=1 Tax=Heterodontus francisci TaxID=7792 RepID=UPI00355AEFC5